MAMVSRTSPTSNGVCQGSIFVPVTEYDGDLLILTDFNSLNQRLRHFAGQFFGVWELPERCQKAVFRREFPRRPTFSIQTLE